VLLRYLSILVVAVALGGCITAPTATDMSTHNAGSASIPSVSENTRAAVNYLSPCLTITDPQPRGFYLGLGSADNLAQAKQHAYRDIAEQISVQINSQSTGNIHKTDVSVNRNWQEHIESNTNAKLDHVRLDCLDRQDPSGQIHLALRYDGRPIANQFAERIVGQLGFNPRRLLLNGSRSLIDSDLLIATRRQVESLDGKQDAQLDISINQQGAHWQIMVGDSLIEVGPEQLSYVVKWSALAQGGLRLNALDDQGFPLDAQLQLAPQTEYRWHIASSRSGYLHLIGIYQDGSFDVIREDIAISDPGSLQIPEGDGVFESGLIAPDSITSDVYIAIWTEMTLDQSHLAGLFTSHQLGPYQSLNRLLLALEQLPPNTESAVATRTMLITPEH